MYIDVHYDTTLDPGDWFGSTDELNHLLLSVWLCVLGHEPTPGWTTVVAEQLARASQGGGGQAGAPL